MFRITRRMFEYMENSFRNVRWFMEYALLDDDEVAAEKHVDSYRGRTTARASARAANPLVKIIPFGELFTVRDVFDAII